MNASYWSPERHAALIALLASVEGLEIEDLPLSKLTVVGEGGKRRRLTVEECEMLAHAGDQAWHLARRLKAFECTLNPWAPGYDRDVVEGAALIRRSQPEPRPGRLRRLFRGWFC